MEYAKANSITKIIIAKPPGTLWQRLTGQSVANQILRRSENIDVHLISSAESVRRGKRLALEEPELVRSRRGYLRGAGLVALTTLVGKLEPQFFDPTNMIMVYLLCVGTTAFLWGYGPSIMVSILSVLVFDFLFIPPFFTFTAYDTKYFLTFLVLLTVGLSISYLMRKIRQQTEVVTQHERQTAALYALGQDLATSNDLESYIHAIKKRVEETFGRVAMIFLPDNQDKGTLKPHAENLVSAVGENELAAATWSFQNRRMSGPGTDTLPNAEFQYVPLVTPRGTVGILALSAAGDRSELTVEQEQLLEAYADLAAIAIESMILSEEARNPKTSHEHTEHSA
jgi:two-component system sensor histidine kinase KdpD